MVVCEVGSGQRNARSCSIAFAVRAKTPNDAGYLVPSRSLGITRHIQRKQETEVRVRSLLSPASPPLCTLNT